MRLIKFWSNEFRLDEWQKAERDAGLIFYFRKDREGLKQASQREWWDEKEK